MDREGLGSICAVRLGVIPGARFRAKTEIPSRLHSWLPEDVRTELRTEGPKRFLAALSALESVWATICEHGGGPQGLTPMDLIKYNAYALRRVLLGPSRSNASTLDLPLLSSINP